MEDSDLDVYEKELYGDTSDQSDSDHDIENHLYSQAHYSSCLQISDKHNTEVTNNNSDSQVFPEIQVESPSFILGMPDKKANKKILHTALTGEDGEQWDLDDVDMGANTPTKSSARYYTASLPNIFCRNCDQKGHLQRNCQKPQKLPNCYLCGEAGHLRNGCPNDLCYNCLQPGHISKECLEPVVRYWKIARQSCSRCGFFGHLLKSCPEIWRQYHVTTVPDTIVKSKNRNAQNARRFCYNCASRSHFGEDCNQERFSKRTVFSQFIVNYDKCKSTTAVNKPTESKVREKVKNKTSCVTKSKKDGKTSITSDKENLKQSVDTCKVKTGKKERGKDESKCSCKHKDRHSRTCESRKPIADSKEEYIVVEEWTESSQQKTANKIEDIRSTEKTTSKDVKDKSRDRNEQNLVSKLLTSVRNTISKKRKKDEGQFSMATDLNINGESDGEVEILPRKKRKTSPKVVTATSMQPPNKNSNKSISKMVESVGKRFSKSGKRKLDGNGVDVENNKRSGKKNDTVSQNRNGESARQLNLVNKDSNPFAENEDFVSLSSREVSVKNDEKNKKMKLTKKNGKEKQKVTQQKQKRKMNDDVDYRTLKALHTIFSSDDDISDTCGDLRTQLKSKRSSPDINIDIDSLKDQLDVGIEDLRVILNNSRHDGQRKVITNQRKVDLTSYDPKMVVMEDLFGYDLNTKQTRQKEIPTTNRNRSKYKSKKTRVPGVQDVQFISSKDRTMMVDPQQIFSETSFPRMSKKQKSKLRRSLRYKKATHLINNKDFTSMNTNINPRKKNEYKRGFLSKNL